MLAYGPSCRHLFCDCWILSWIGFLISQHIVSDILNILKNIWCSCSCNLVDEISDRFLKWHCFQRLWTIFIVCNKGCLLLKSMIYNNHFLISASVFWILCCFRQQCLQSLSLKFLFRRYANVGCSLKTCFRLLLTSSKFQLSFRIFLKSGKVWLYVMTKGTWVTSFFFVCCFWVLRWMNWSAIDASW